MDAPKWLTTAAGVKMPWIIYGTAWKEEQTEDLVVKAVLAGFRGIDTACQPKHYNEPLVGAALHRLKSEHGMERGGLFLQTKFTPLTGQDPSRVPYDKDAPMERQAAQSFEASLKNLQTDYLDSLVLHSPLTPHTRLMKVWRVMEGIQKAGGTRQLGISNCYHIDVMKRLYADADVKPAVAQNRFYQDTGYDADLREWCTDHGIIYQSFWTLTANPHILASHALRSIARRHSKTEPQIFFRFLHQSGVVPLTGTRSEGHMREDLAAAEFGLSDEDMESIAALLAPR